MTSVEDIWGNMLKIGTIGTKAYAMSKVIRPEHVELHKKGIVHLHKVIVA